MGFFSIDGEEILNGYYIKQLQTDVSRLEEDNVALGAHLTALQEEVRALKEYLGVEVKHNQTTVEKKHGQTASELK